MALLREIQNELRKADLDKQKFMQIYKDTGRF